MQNGEKKSGAKRIIWLVAGAGGLAACCCLMAFAAVFIWSPSGTTEQAAEREPHIWARVELPKPISLQWVKCPSEAVCYITAFRDDAGLMLRSTDGGLTWSPTEPPETEGLSGFFCASETHCFATVWGSGLLYETIDGAQSWIALGDSTTSMWQAEGGDDVWDALDIVGGDCLDTETCYMIADRWDNAHLYMTEDGGQRWQYVRELPGSMDIRAMDCPSAEKCIAVGYGPRPVVVATDGESYSRGSLLWDVSENQDLLAGVSCPSADTCYAAGDGDLILKTTDGGATWARLEAPIRGVGFRDVSCATVDVCVVVTGDPSGVGFAGGLRPVILMTTNGGATWQDDTLPALWEPDLDGGYFDSVSCPSTTRCLAVGSADEGHALRFEGIGGP